MCIKCGMWNFVCWRCVKSAVRKWVGKSHQQSFMVAAPPRHTLWSTLNDVCCSFHTLMWKLAVLCSMWQMIRHANQAEAAVESLIIVPVPHKGPSPPLSTLHRTFTSTPIPLQPSYSQTDRQMGQRLKHWEESFRELAGMVGSSQMEWKFGWIIEQMLRGSCRTDAAVNIWPAAHWLLCVCFYLRINL